MGGVWGKENKALEKLLKKGRKSRIGGGGGKEELGFVFGKKKIGDWCLDWVGVGV